MLLMLAVVLLACGSENEVFPLFRVHREAHPMLKSVLNFVTNWTNIAFYGWFLWTLVQSIRKGDKRTTRFVLIYIAVQLIISLVLVRFLKMSIARPRPGEDPFPPSFTTKPSYHSMPSGHTTEATTSIMTLAGRTPKWTMHLVFGLILALLGFSRIYLGWHHPSDIFCGWLLGSVAGMAVTLLAPKQETNSEPPAGFDGDK